MIDTVDWTIEDIDSHCEKHKPDIIVIDQLDIKGKSVQAKVKFSKSVSDQFNDIIEQTTGVETEKRFSDVQANLRSKKGRYFNLVPPSAQDFAGLLYNFLGKGRTGEQQFKFFKKTLIDPFAKGITLSTFVAPPFLMLVNLPTVVQTQSYNPSS